MNDDGYLWDEATVTYPDMKGTAQLDVAMTKPQIEELVGLDLERWMVIGLDIGGGEHRHELRVIAVPKDLFAADNDTIETVAAANGGALPATEFLIHDVDPYEILQAISHVFEFRLRWRGIADTGTPVRIVNRADVPEQE